MHSIKNRHRCMDYNLHMATLRDRNLTRIRVFPWTERFTQERGDITLAEELISAKQISPYNHYSAIEGETALKLLPKRVPYDPEESRGRNRNKARVGTYIRGDVAKYAKNASKVDTVKEIIVGPNMGRKCNLARINSDGFAVEQIMFPGKYYLETKQSTRGSNSQVPSMISVNNNKIINKDDENMAKRFSNTNESHDVPSVTDVQSTTDAKTPEPMKPFQSKMSLREFCGVANKMKRFWFPEF